MSENKQSEQEVKKIDIYFIGGWIIGTILLLMTITQIFSNFISGLCFLIATSLVLPPINKIIKGKIKISLSGGLKTLIVIILVILGSSLASSDELNQYNNPSQETKIDIPSKIVEQPITTPEVKTSPKTITQTTEQPKIKTYQQIFTFSGNGAKKSEPFTVTGSRFKIKYNCLGDLCQAFLYKIGGSFPQEVIMNAAASINDETIVYGAGEYYIDSNSMGTYTMTVEDYK